jgi:hypothetical protein
MPSERRSSVISYCEQLQMLTLLLLVAVHTHVIAGPSSAYAPGDGHNSGELACRGRFTRKQIHVAVRRWRQYGCRSPVLVYSRSTGRAVWGRVMDGGPYGIINESGERRVWTKTLRPPQGWRWRGAVDISVGMWIKLGRPRFLSRVYMWIIPQRVARALLVLRRLLDGGGPEAGGYFSSCVPGSGRSVHKL